MAGFRVASVCSGICAPTTAWKSLGWETVYFSEIDRFASAVLAHRHPGIPNLGDFTRIRNRWTRRMGLGSIDLLVGGTPCQSFSVAGLRGGLADERGNLALEFLRLARRARPEWLVWENVPGVLSSNGGRDFGAFLGALAELGYGWAYRVLDAQHFGVPQRRRRVFVVGHLGDWRRAVSVLFERHSLSGNSPPSRETKSEVAGCIGGGSGNRGWCDDLDRSGAFIPETAYCVRTQARRIGQGWADTMVAQSLTGSPHADRGDGDEGKLVVAPTLFASNGGASSGYHPVIPIDLGQSIAHTLRGEGFDASEDGTGRGTPLVPVSWGITCDAFDRSGESASGLAADRCGLGITEELSPTLRAKRPNAVGNAVGVRRLTPRECERLQGFPDDYTLITYRGKPAPDSSRYKAIGNSIAVPVIRWIGERIRMVNPL